MTRAVLFSELGGPEDLRISEIEDVALAPDEVRFDVRAFALNRADLLFLSGTHYTLPRFPSRIGSEASGVVTEVGPAVTRFAVGDQVSSIPFFSDAHGVQGDSAVVPQDYLSAVPAGMDPLRATSIWMQYLTPWFAFVDAGRLLPGDTVLITAATSSAGLGALQIARLLGLSTVATTRTPTKQAALLQQGADAVVVMPDPTDLAAQVAEVSGGRQLSAAFDPIGGDSLGDYVDLLGSGARVFGYGLLSGRNPVVPVAEMCRVGATFHPYSMFNHVGDRKLRTDACAKIIGALQEGRLEPVIDVVFSFEEIIDAYRHMQSNEQLGKIVVQVGDGTW